MPWKEPGEKPREPRDPWGHGNRNEGGGGGGPGFDLDARIRQWRRRLGPFGRGPLGVLAIIVLLILLWFALGSWTLIGDRQVGIVLRFGHIERTLSPGLHLRFPEPIEQVMKVDTGRSHTISDQLRMMTRDSQLALIDYYAEYKIGDARKFLFSVRDAEGTARDAATVVVRAIVGAHTMQQLRTRSGDEFSGEIRKRLQTTMDHYDAGIEITDAGIQDVNVPTEVKKAFDDIVKARQDAKGAQTAAQANADRQEANARAQAESIKADADAYHTRTVAAAQAGVARFQQVLASYQAAPDSTRRRLWLQTMQDVLSKNHVVVNTGRGNVIVQFPPRVSVPAPATTTTAPPPATASSSPAPVMKGNGL